MTSSANLQRLSSVWGPYSSVRLLRAREKKDWPRLLAAKFSSKASKPLSWSFLPMPMMSWTHCLMVSVS